ncbi:cation efflux protein, CzcI-like [Acinetobacter sp. ANC 4648]|uniref:cation efflux protein, CzcI-like n=1 Tax=Acinetobacter sp. ANC 4648 TaxID=1977875 RepID=UPI000A354A0A|nr:cation efflux protein, CzcI-like [Acinetobacter sp. ANC 4648]OTG84952.1 hypothetical protein B9T27_01650 [Acinetobacter sp. ANC 4648]
MQRSGILITVLLSLFMFQSLWNVAAAFCGHEVIQNNPSSHISVQHFGHHVALSCQTDEHANVANQHQSTELNDSMSALAQNLQDDHSDHLPSFSHFMIADIQQKADEPHLSAYINLQFMDWKNLYQSPHLYLPNPPPVFSPL